MTTLHRVQGLVAEVNALRALIDDNLALLPSDQLIEIHNRLIEIYGELPFDGAPIMRTT